MQRANEDAAGSIDALMRENVDLAAHVQALSSELEAARGTEAAASEQLQKLADQNKQLQVLASIYTSS